MRCYQCCKYVRHIPARKSSGCEDAQVSHGSGSAQAGKPFTLRLSFSGFSLTAMPQHLGALGGGRGHHLNSHLHSSPVCFGMATIQCFLLESVLRHRLLIGEVSLPHDRNPCDELLTDHLLGTLFPAEESTCSSCSTMSWHEASKQNYSNNMLVIT